MKILRYVFVFLTVLCIGFIWVNSSFDAEQSSGLSFALVEFINDLFNINITEGFIRKLAHFTEFAGLGYLLTSDFSFFGCDIKKCWYNIAFIGLLTACIDETIQIFPMGRNSAVTDIWIDFAGVCCAVAVTHILYKCINIKKWLTC